jgi:uncharacterized protein involved in exopolysaccharide biosynthesis
MTATPHSAPSQGQPPVGDIQLATLWQAVRRSFKGLLVTAALVGGGTYGVQSLMAPRYTSESQLEFTAKRANPLPEQGDRQPGPDTAARLDQAAINTHARALLSSDLLLKVAGDLKLRNRVEFNSALGPVDTWSGLLRLAGIGAPLPGETEDERVLSVLRRQLVVAAIKDTRWIGISFASTDSKLAADFANALAEAYRASLVSQPIEETNKAVEALTPKVEQLRKEVLDAEAEVERYRASSGQFKAGPQSTPVNDQRMAGLQDELLKVEAARNEADARWRTARELMQSGSAEVLPDVQKSALIQGLIQQRVRLERQIAETSAALLPGHPRMQQLNADVAGLRRQIAAEVQKVVQSIEKDARSAALRVDAVTKQIDQLKTKVVGQTGNEARLKELESLARSKRTELERLQKQLEDNRTVVNIRQVPIEAQIISRALPSATPTSPRKGPSALLASAAALILGLAFVVTKALVSAPIHLPHSPTAAARAPVTGRIEDVHAEPMFAPPAPGAQPKRPAAALKPARAAPSTSAAAVPQAIKDLTLRLVTRTDVTAGVRTLVAGDEAGIDALPQAKVLAETLSAAGKRVLLITWSLSGQRRRASDAALGIPGMCDLITGAAPFEKVISRMQGSNVHLIKAGSPPADLASVLAAERLNLTLDALDEAYEQIVIAADFSDAQLLFEAIEGRFDAAVVVTREPRIEHGADSPDVLLGFEVTGIDTVHVPLGAASEKRITGIASLPLKRAAG